jgi:3-hydroxybutyryl-CoA dehydrogenase
MQIVVYGDESQRQELIAPGLQDPAKVEWISKVSEFQNHPGADAYIDLLFEALPERMLMLESLSAKPVIVNSVSATLSELAVPFVRFNGWPGFLQSQTIEASCNSEDVKKQAESIFMLFNRRVEWVADIPGFITPRVISMIINEAYFTLEEGVSTKAEIDTAMKLGTNYPFGPFEWSEKIGIEKICSLLSGLSKTNSRYKPSSLLKKEAGN